MYFSFLSRQAFVSPSKKTTESKITSELVKPQGSDVSPLMDDRKQSTVQELQRPERPSFLHLTSEKKRIPVEISADSLAVSSGMRKSQSIHNISSEGETSRL